MIRRKVNGDKGDLLTRDPSLRSRDTPVKCHSEHSEESFFSQFDVEQAVTHQNESPLTGSDRE